MPLLFKGKPCPWLDAEIKILMAERDQFLRKAQRTNLETDCNNYRTHRNKYNNMLRNSKKIPYKSSR